MLSAVCFLHKNGLKFTTAAFLEEDSKKRENFCKIIDFFKNNQSPETQIASIGLMNSLISAEDVEILQNVFHSINSLQITQIIKEVEPNEENKETWEKLKQFYLSNLENKKFMNVQKGRVIKEDKITPTKEIFSEIDRKTKPHKSIYPVFKTVLQDIREISSYGDESLWGFLSQASYQLSLIDPANENVEESARKIFKFLSNENQGKKKRFFFF